MSKNAFSDWTPEMVARHNEQLAKQRLGKYEPKGKPADTFTAVIPSAVSESVFVIHTEPVAAPRMTRRDKWKKRPCVERYFQYRDKVRSAVGDIPIVPDAVHSRFFLPMPESWSKKKQKEMDGKPHRQRPDRDNLDKAIMDALFLEDGGVWCGSQEKRWCKPGQERIELTFSWNKNINP